MNLNEEDVKATEEPKMFRIELVFKGIPFEVLDELSDILYGILGFMGIAVEFTSVLPYNPPAEEEEEIPTQETEN